MSVKDNFEVPQVERPSKFVGLALCLGGAATMGACFFTDLPPEVFMAGTVTTFSGLYLMARSSKNDGQQGSSEI